MAEGAHRYTNPLTQALRRIIRTALQQLAAFCRRTDTRATSSTRRHGTANEGEVLYPERECKDTKHEEPCVSARATSPAAGCVTLQTLSP